MATRHVSVLDFSQIPAELQPFVRGLTVMTAVADLLSGMAAIDPKSPPALVDRRVAVNVNTFMNKLHFLNDKDGSKLREFIVEFQQQTGLGIALHPVGEVAHS